ncbi:MAG: DUF4350 domain-containing protein [Planctomycetota bacterium]
MTGHVRVLWVGMLVLAAALQPVGADEPLVFRSASGALGPFVQPGSWCEVVVSLENPGESDQDATVTLSAPGAKGTAHFSRELSVTAGTARMTRVFVLVPPLPTPEQGAAVDIPSQTELGVTLFSPTTGRIRRSFLTQTVTPESPALHILRAAGEPHDTDTYISLGGRIAVCRVGFRDADGQPLPAEGDEPALSGDSEWTSKTVERTVPTGARSIVISPTIHGTGTLEIDDVRVEPVAGAGGAATQPTGEAGPAALQPVTFDAPNETWRIGQVTRVGQAEGDNRFARLTSTDRDTETSFEMEAPLPPGVRAVRISARLRGRELRGGRGLFAEMPRVLGLTRDMPTRWMGLDMVGLLLMTSGAGEQLSPSQTGALLDWVRRGGTLVLASDADMPDLLRGRFGRVAGVAAAGTHRVSRLDVRKRTAQGPRDIGRFELEWPLPMAELLVTDATVHYEANGLPLLTERCVGQGRVFALATPLGALGISRTDPTKLQDVLREVRPGGATSQLAVAPDHVHAGDGEGEAVPADAALRSIAGRRGPAPAVPVAIMAALSGLVLVGGLLLRLRGRGELVWVVLIPLSVCLSIGIYTCGRRQVADEQLSFVGLITPVGEGQVRVQESFAYYSGRSSREVGFTSGAERASIRPTELTSPTRRREIRTGRYLHMPRRTVRTGAGAVFRADALIAAPGLSGYWSFDADGLTGRVRNDMPADLTHCVILAGRRTYRLNAARTEQNTIPADGEVRPRVGPDDMLRHIEYAEPERPGAGRFGATGRAMTAAGATGEFTGSAVMTRIDNIRNEFVSGLIRPPAAVAEQAPPLLIGYTAYCPLDPLPDRDLPRHGWNVVAWPMEFAPPAPEDRAEPVQIPAGFVTTRYRGAMVWNPMTRQFVGSQYGGELTVRAAAPEGFGRLRDTTVTLIVTLRAPGKRLVVRGVEGGEVDKGRRVVPPGAGQTEFDNPRLQDERIVIPDADAFANRRGEYVFILQVEDLGEQPTDITDIPEWRFERVDVALEGTYQEEPNRDSE